MRYKSEHRGMNRNRILKDGFSFSQYFQGKRCFSPRICLAHEQQLSEMVKQLQDLTVPLTLNSE